MAKAKSPHHEFKDRAEELGLSNIPNVQIGRPVIVTVEEMAAEILNDRKVDFTVDRAVDYINLPVFPGERDVVDSHVQFLLDEIQRGRFNWNIVIIARCDLDGTTYKINGQHTSWARLGLPEKSDIPKVREIHYKVQSITALKALYSTFDRAKARTDPHLTRVELVGTAATDGLHYRTISRLAPAVRFWLYPARDEYRRIGPAELASLIANDYCVLFNTVGRYIQTLQGKTADARVLRMPVMAAMLDNFAKVPTVAPDFWTDVAYGTNLVKTDARWHLVDYLDKVAISSAGSEKRSVSGDEVYRYCITAWNRWRKGEKVQTLRPTAKRVRSA